METSPEDRALEQRLRQARPEPRPQFVDALERRLFPEATPRRTRRRRPVLAGAVAAAGLASLAFAFALAGGGPLGGDEGSKARDDCRYVTVKKQIRVREPVVDSEGRTRLRSEPRLVERRIKRCR